MKKLVLIIIFFTILDNANAQAFFVRMQKVAPMPESVSNNAVVEGWANDTAYVFSFGGIDTTKIWSGIHLKGFKYNTSTDVWDTIPPLPDSMGKIACGASYVDSIIYIIGGYHVLSNGNEISSNKVHRYDPRTNTYLSDGANIPIPIDDHVQAVWKDSLIYVITGWSNTTNIPNVQIYDPANNQWLTGTSTPNTNNYICFGGSGTIQGDSIIYHGGASNQFNFPGQSNLRVGHINPSNPTQIIWSISQASTSEISYRSVAINLPLIGFDYTYWLGGSGTTYNYNGIAYNGSGGVNPRNYPIYLNHFSNQFESQLMYATEDTLPMDLRGFGFFPNMPNSMSFGVAYTAGGMIKNQQVSNKTYKIWVEYVVGINEKSDKYTFYLYPNPTSNELHLTFKNQSHHTIQILDLLGKEISNFHTNKTIETIDVSPYPPGIYLIKVSSEKGSSTQKIVIQ